MLGGILPQRQTSNPSPFLLYSMYYFYYVYTYISTWDLFLFSVVLSIEPTTQIRTLVLSLFPSLMFYVLQAGLRLAM